MSAESPQAEVWKGNFGREYTDRNNFNPVALDDLWLRNYGISRTSINRDFLSDLSKSSSFLEVGCNVGNQLVLLRQIGWSNLAGIELQPYAHELAMERLPGADLKLGSALDLPWPDSLFDVVFTSGVLIHIAPADLPRALDEIYRTSRRYIWGSEYFSAEPEQIHYRGHTNLLWKRDFAACYLKRFPDLELVKEQRLPYLSNPNVDTVFLLKKRTV